MRRKEINMTEGPLFSGIISFTIPVILTSLLQLLFNAADMIVVGKFGSENSVGAVGANTALINLIVTLFIGLATGSGAVLAHAIGEKQEQRIKDTVRTAVPLSILCGIVLSIIGVVGSKWFLTWMNTPEDIIDLATVYLRIYFVGVMPSMVYNFVSALLRAAGDSKNPMVSISVAGVLNVLLNLLFVIVFKMDVAGVALATTISNILSAGFVVIALRRREDHCRLDFKTFKICKDRLIPIIRLGVPAGVQGCLMNVANVLIQRSLNEFGSTVVTGVSAGHSIEMFAQAFIGGYSHASLNFSAQNMGARKYDRVKKSIFISCACAFVTGAVFGPLVYRFAPVLISIYLKDPLAEMIEAGVTRMSFACRNYGIMGTMDSLNSGIRGIGSSTVPMVISIVGALGFRVLWLHTVFAIPEYHTVGVLFMSLPISWLLMLIANAIALVIIWKRLMKKEGMSA